MRMSQVLSQTPAAEKETLKGKIASDIKETVEKIFYMHTHVQDTVYNLCEGSEGEG